MSDRVSRLVYNPNRRTIGSGRCAARDDVLAFHRSLPGYESTPLRSAPRSAAGLGVRIVLVKDESRRLGMPSFKILGASWAVYRLLCERIGSDSRAPIPLSQLARLLRPEGPLELVAATDGNHGRAVARMARLLGLTAHILVPRDIAPARVTALRNEHARVTVVAGSYDDAVRESAELADESHLVVSDMSWPGYTAVPAWVIDGYGTIAFEIQEQLAVLDQPPPNVVAVQIGVGAFAAGILPHLPESTRVIGVEPTAAAGALASAEAGALTTVDPPHDSIMAGLNCGEPSPVAWPVISRRVDAFAAVDDEYAEAAMCRLAQDGIVAGESGAAGLAGLLAYGPEFGLSPDDTVLTIVTEGATDPVAYHEILSALRPDLSDDGGDDWAGDRVSRVTRARAGSS